MKSWRALCETLHVTALGIWAGAVVISGGFAAIIFSTVKKLEPSLKDYDTFPDQTYRVVAGSVAQKVFLIDDMVGFACAMTAVVTFICSVLFFQTSMRRPATMLRSLSLSVAIAAFASGLLFVTPPLNNTSVLHWAALRSGDAVMVAKHQAALNDIHPIASTLLITVAVSVLISLVMAVWSLSAPWKETAIEAKPAKYAEPELLRGVRK